MKTRTRGIPKYLTIAQGIIERVGSGSLPLGAQVPSENELIEQHGVSNTTARRVLAELEKSGWVTRIKGRGTFVRQNRVERSVSRILGFTRNMIEAGRAPSTRLLGIRVLRESRSLEISGRLYTVAAPLYEVQRLRLADSVPMMKETRYVSMQFCPGLDRQNLEGSLYDIYEREYGLRLARIDQILRATILEGRALGAFETDEPMPAFRVEGVTFIAKEVILEMEESIYRGDAYSFYVTATQ